LKYIIKKAVKIFRYKDKDTFYYYAYPLKDHGFPIIFSGDSENLWKEKYGFKKDCDLGDIIEIKFKNA